MTDTKVYHLTGSDDVTRQIGSQGGLADKALSKAVEVAAGNPGAMTYLVQISKSVDALGFSLMCDCLNIKKFRGSDFYSFVKRFGVDGAISEMRKAGWV